MGPNYRVFKKQPEQQKHHILFIAITLRAKTSSHFRKEVNTNNTLRFPHLLHYLTIESKKQRQEKQQIVTKVLCCSRLHSVISWATHDSVRSKPSNLKYSLCCWILFLFSHHYRKTAPWLHFFFCHCPLTCPFLPVTNSCLSPHPLWFVKVETSRIFPQPDYWE